MALVVKDRVLETTSTTGTGTITLAGAQATYQAFSVIGDGNTTYYAIVSQTANEWEVGLGTYTASGTTLSRDTILSSSASGAAVDFSAGLKNVFVTYPSEKSVYLDATDESNSALTIGTTPIKLGETVTTLAGLESVEVTQDPTTALQLATKQYVDTLVASGIHFHEPVRVESPINLNATYNNGTAGVGATLTNAGTQAALVIDGITLSAADRVLVYQQTNQTQNGVYVVTDVGSGSTNWILTRASDADTFENANPNGLSEGSTFFVQQGTTGAGETYTCNTTGTIVFGTTNITFAQVSSAQIYSAGTGLTLTGTQFSITNTAVTPASYGSASKTLTATVNAQGQLTALADTNIAIGMSQVTSGTLGVTQGGTGFSSYSVGDLIYADTTTSFAKLAGVATGNVLLSGGVSAAPSWGKVALASAVSGTLPVANGGTGNTTTQAAINNLAGATTSGQYLRGNGTNVVMSAIQAGDVPTLNQNTTGSAATLTTGRTIAITGDLTYTSGSFNGSANVTGTGTLATVNANVGSFTNASLTVNAKGLVTAVSSGTAPVTSVTGTSPVTSSGGTTPAISLASGYGDTQNPYASKTANFVLAAPNAANGVPTFRALVASDIPTLNQNTTGTAASVTNATQSSITSIPNLATVGTITSGTWSGSFGAVSGANLTTLNASNLSSGTVPGDRGVTAGSASSSFVEYNGTTATDGQFYGGTTTPTGTTRLNYGGYFYPTFINLVGSGDTTTAATHYFVETGSDGFVRPKTLANVRTEVVTSAAVTGGLGYTPAPTYAGGAVFENTQTISANYTMTAGKSGSSTGPITIDSGVTVTIPSGSRWVVL